MSMYRVPVLSKDAVLLLQSLVKLDHARAMRKLMTEHELQKTGRIQALVDHLDLSDKRSNVEQPLLVCLALMEMNGKPSMVLPMTELGYGYYRALVGAEITADDFPGVPDDVVESVLEPIRAGKAELIRILEECGYLSGEGARAGLDAAPRTGSMVN